MDGKINNYVKMDAVENFFQSVDREKYSRFTNDFLENWLYTDREDKESLKECILALEYEVDAILEIINPTIPDFQFFTELKQIIVY